MQQTDVIRLPEIVRDMRYQNRGWRKKGTIAQNNKIIVCFLRLAVEYALKGETVIIPRFGKFQIEKLPLDKLPQKIRSGFYKNKETKVKCNIKRMGSKYSINLKSEAMNKMGYKFTASKSLKTILHNLLCDESFVGDFKTKIK
jgi:nucleoid DNA-binding protein